MLEALRYLGDYSGQYKGRGVNHEGQAFTGELTLKPLAGLPGLALRFVAKGDDGTIYHQEESVVARDQVGHEALWTLCSNAPGMLQLALRRATGDDAGDWRTVVFGLGEPSDGDTFREEISIDLHQDGALGYRFAWGLPGSDFVPRSSALMYPAERSTR